MAMGCATFRAEPLLPEKTVSALEARTLLDPALKKFLEDVTRHEITPWPPTSWDLSMLTLAAYYYHPDLPLAKAGWDAAKAGVQTAGGRPNPSISLAPQHVGGEVSGVSPWVLGPTFDIPIETAGKRRYRIAKAKHLSEAARLNIATVAWQIRSRLRSKWLDLYTATQEEKILQEEQAAQEKYSKFLQERLVGEEVSPLTVAQSQIVYERTLLSLRQLRQRRIEARAQLAAAVGLPAHALDEVEISFALLDKLPFSFSVGEICQRALLSRPDILAVLEEYAASQAALQLEVAKQYPDLHFGPGYSWDQGTEKWSLGVSVSLPVLDRNQGPIAEAGARRTEAAARFMALQVKVLGEVERALTGYETTLETFEAADELLTAQTNQYRISERLLASGGATQPALLLARAELNAAALARLHAFVQVQQSFGSLEDAVQYPLDGAETVTLPLPFFERGTGDSQ